MNKSLKMQTAKAMVLTLNKILKIDANSTSCGIVYQPKAQKDLEKFKNKK